MSAGPRHRRNLKGELVLALMPTGTVLLVLAFVQALSHERLLFASLASSAFLIYLDPGHEMNQVRTLVLSQLGSAVAGWACHEALGAGYASAGLAMVLSIVSMVLAGRVHPPAVSTALGFGLRSEDERTIVLFAVAVLITAVLVGLQQVLQRLVRIWR